MGDESGLEWVRFLRSRERESGLAGARTRLGSFRPQAPNTLSSCGHLVRPRMELRGKALL